MQNTFKTLSMIIIASLLAACGSTQSIKVGEFTSGDCEQLTGIEETPDWICAPDHLFPQGYLYVKGKAPGSAVQWDYAATQAMANLAFKVNQEAKYESLVKSSFQKEDSNNSDSGTLNLTKSVEAALKGVRVEEQGYWINSETQEYYLLIRVKESEVLAALRRMNIRDDKLFEQQVSNSNINNTQNNNVEL